MLFYCISSVNLHANDKQAFIPDLSKSNIKKVHVHRVNCYDYSGGGTNMIEESNRGILIAELHNPKDSWVIYKFDLSPIINDNNLTEGIKHKKIVKPEYEEDSLIIYGKDTLDYYHSFKDTCYNIKIRLIDTLSYLHYISDTIFTSGYGKLPQVITYNPLFKTHHYIIHDNQVRHWEDSLFRDYYLGFMLPKTENSLYKLILPKGNNLGMVDTINIKEIVIDNLHEYLSYESSHLYFNQKAEYDDLETAFCRYGFILFKDTKGDLWHVSGTSLFKLDSHLMFSNEDEYYSLGNSFIQKKYQGDNPTYIFFSANHPSGKKLGFKWEINIGVQANIRQEMDWMEEIYSDIIINDNIQDMYLLSTESGNTKPINKSWRLLKDYGWIREDSPLIETKYKTHFLGNDNYSNKLIFIAPKNKIMIYGDGQFYELTKKKIKEMGG